MRHSGKAAVSLGPRGRMSSGDAWKDVLTAGVSDPVLLGLLEALWNGWGLGVHPSDQLMSPAVRLGPRIAYVRHILTRVSFGLPDRGLLPATGLRQR